METEFWKSHPEYAGIEVSTLGNVRTLDRVTSNEKITCFTKGRVLKQQLKYNGYMQIRIPVDEKWVTKLVHRLVAQAFIPNPNNLPQINHKDCDPTNNNVENLEWCTSSYDAKYREKHGISRAEAIGHPLFAINLSTLKVSRFKTQHQASQTLGINQQNINSVIKDKRKQAGGYFFVNDDGNAVIKFKDDKHILTED